MKGPLLGARSMDPLRPFMLGRASTSMRLRRHARFSMRGPLHEAILSHRFGIGLLEYFEINYGHVVRKHAFGVTRTKVTSKRLKILYSECNWISVIHTGPVSL